MFAPAGSGSVRAADSGHLPDRSCRAKEVSGIEKAYEAPKITVLGQFPVLTLQQSDKIGSTPDLITALIPQLDGSIVPD